MEARRGQGLSTRNVIGVLALFCTMSEFAILTPSIAAFSHHFVGTDITTIMFANSITGIVSVPVSVLSGAILHRVGFKPMAILGILVMSLGGAFPFLMPDITDYTLVIVSRVIVGIGLGVMFPVGNATIIALFEGEKRSRLLGLGITIQFLFNLIYTTVAGYLTEIGWNYSFLAYLIGLVPLVVALAWMPEAKGVVAEGRERERVERSSVAKEKIPHAIWGYALFALATWTCVVTVQIDHVDHSRRSWACKLRSGGARHQLLRRRHHSLRPCVSDACPRVQDAPVRHRGRACGDRHRSLHVRR